ncbi:MAG: TonB family protein, partial [Reyranella sp.]|nr:TonB family protein [Reyranella sp.]
ADRQAGVPAPPSDSAELLLGQGRARNSYLDRVARHTSRYRYYPRVALEGRQEGRVVTRVTIARDGGLIDVRIDKSSGWPAIDAAELDALRKSAPFPPVPPDMPGDPLILILPINYDLTIPRGR